MERTHDRALQLHQFGDACFRDLGRNLVRHVERRRVLFLRVREHAEPLEAVAGDQFLRRLEVGLGLARETGDQRAAHGDAGHLAAQAVEDATHLLAGDTALHRLQHRRGDVLDRDVEVLHRLRMLAQERRQLRQHGVRVGIHQPDPADAVDLAELLEQRVDLALSRRVEAVGGAVLGDDDQFLHAGGGEVLRFFDQHLDRLAAVLAAHLRDRAERAGVVAALADAQVGEALRRQQEALGVAARALRLASVDRCHPAARAAVDDLAHDGRHARVVGQAEHRVEFLDVLAQVVAVALGQAADGDDALQVAFFLQARDRQDGVDRLLLGGLDEAAGVDDDDVGVGGFLDHHQAFFDDVAEQHLGVDEVAGAAQADHRHADRFVHGICSQSGGSQSGDRSRGTAAAGGTADRCERRCGAAGARPPASEEPAPHVLAERAAQASSLRPSSAGRPRPCS